MSANPKSRLTTAAETFAILGTIIAYLAFAYTIGWWPFNDVKAIPPSTRVAIAPPTSAVTATSTPVSAAVPPTPTRVPMITLSPVSTLGIGLTKIFPIDGAPMVFIPAGEFLMGSNDSDSLADVDERPQHQVYLDAFWMDKFETTNGQYSKCVNAGKCPAPSENRSYTHNSYYGTSQFDDYPVIYVSWNDATRFCEWAGKRLPTEAEWEKAARGTDGRVYPWGNTFDKNMLNSLEGKFGDTAAVGSYPSGVSLYGVMDMAGNVWEWVADWYGLNYYRDSPTRNPPGPSFGERRGLRGGAWGNIGQDSARVANRDSDVPDDRYFDVGLRCAVSFSEP